MLVWEDKSSHGKTDNTWELKLPGGRLVVTRHIHYPNKWLVTCDYFHDRTIDDMSSDDARSMALEMLRRKINTLKEYLDDL